MKDCFELVLKSETKSRSMTGKAGQTVLEVLGQNGIYLSAPCGGRGSCGKCKVRLLSGILSATGTDEKLLSEEELHRGVRLACTAKPEGDIAICLHAGQEQDFQILGLSAAKTPGAKGVYGAEALGQYGTESKDEADGGFGIAVDIGTTTIAAALIGLADGKVLAQAAAVNRQRGYGSDVISRILASTQGKGPVLQNSIREDLRSLTGELLKESGIRGDNVERVVLCGNTTMGHLLMGYPCETLGVYPFTPVKLSTVRGSYREIAGGGLSCDTILLPGISAFVGGDIVSGLLACGFDHREELSLLIDLGTNGEMALGNQDRILVTSAPAGPAFEGGNLSCGMGSVAGAICDVTIKMLSPGAGERQKQPQIRVETIRGAVPKGLCGSGVIALVSELLKNGLIDETGLLDERYEDGGFPVALTAEGERILLTQKDIRELQLAKSAVRAGLETLIKKYGAKLSDIKRVYLAGGFGYKLDKGKAASIGLFPKELLPEMEAIGNSSLQGVVDYLLLEDAPERVEKLLQSSDEITLAKDALFSELYMEYMMF